MPGRSSKPLTGKVALVAGATRGAGLAGRAIAALAADPDVARWSGQVVSTGQLAPIYGFTDTDGSQPDCWRYVVDRTRACRLTIAATAELSDTADDDLAR
jgi:hypothetical protein